MEVENGTGKEDRVRMLEFPNSLTNFLALFSP